MTRRKKVIIFLQGGVGGAERMSVFIGKSLNREYFDVKFVTVSKGDNGQTIKQFIPKEYEVVDLFNTNVTKLIKNIYLAIKREDPEVVFSSVYFLNNKVIPMSFMFPKVRFVIRIENYLYTFNLRKRFIMRCLYRRASAIIAQTQEMKDELVEQLHVKASKVVVFENPVDKESIDLKVADSHNPFPNDGKKHVVAVGRFAYQKGYDLLVEAMSIIRNKEVDVDLYIVGANTGAWYNHYVAIIRDIQRLGIIDSVHCVGFDNNPYQYMKYADCFVLSSRWEGLPNVLAEALYLKIPVAAFKCIPIVERMVRNGIDGFLAEKEDVKGLADAICKAMEIREISPVYKGASKDDYEELFKTVLTDKNDTK